MKYQGKYKRKISEPLSAEMQELFLSGLSMKEVAEYAGISRQAAHQHFQKEGIKRPVIVPDYRLPSIYGKQFDGHINNHNEVMRYEDWISPDSTSMQVSEDLYLQRRRAYAAIRNALIRGIIRPKPCEVCGAERTQAHHDDYTKPLDVRWLCVTHHNEWHKKHGKGKLTTGFVSVGGQLLDDGLRAVCIKLFGRRGWQVGLARFLKKPNGKHVDVRTVRRWCNEESPVPFWVNELLKAEVARRAA